MALSLTSLRKRNSPTIKVAREVPTTEFINATELSSFGRKKLVVTYSPEKGKGMNPDARGVVRSVGISNNRETIICAFAVS